MFHGVVWCKLKCMYKCGKGERLYNTCATMRQFPFVKSRGKAFKLHVLYEASFLCKKKEGKLLKCMCNNEASFLCKRRGHCDICGEIWKGQPNRVLVNPLLGGFSPTFL